MKKKVHVVDLRPGMYVSELDRPWIETPFLFQGFEIAAPEEIEKLRQHCKYVYIDVELGCDVAPTTRNSAYHTRMQELKKSETQIKKRVRQIASVIDSVHQPAQQRIYPDKATFEEEIVRAKEIEKMSRETMVDVIKDAQAGEKIDLPRAKRVVETMVDSVVRNPDALVCLSQLKELSEYTALHSIRTCIIGLAFGRHLVFSRDDLNSLGLGLLLHDIGMVSVPEFILNKPSALDAKEFELLQRHIPHGIEVLKKSGDLPIGAENVVMQHHERFDGSGYPEHRRDDSISTFGAIAGIVDVYDAITSNRTYKTAISAEDALGRMYEWRGRDFNGALIEEFIRCMGIFPIGSLVELNTGVVGVVITINRARRLKPKVVTVLDAKRHLYRQKAIIDLAEQNAPKANETKISRVLPTGSYNINPMEHIVTL